MSDFDQIRIQDGFENHLQAFQQLAPFKIRDILLVSSLYDSYLVEEDGRLYEMIRREYQGLNLIHVPEVTFAPSGAEGLRAIQGGHFDLIIMTPHIKDMHAIEFANRVRSAGCAAPIVMLVFDNNERRSLKRNYDISIFERIFIWQGDYRLIVAIIKCVEDRLNVDHDTKMAGVQSIILVEDNVSFYSSYLPLIYTEVINQSQRLISEGVNLTHKFLRMRARPKILLCTNYDDAWAYYEKYSQFILGVISDINFRRGGVKDPEAGIKFARNLRQAHSDIPILLQSSSPENAEKAREAGASFLVKQSPRLLHDLREFIVYNFGFGDFIFRMPDGTVVDRAGNLKALEEKLKTVPVESIAFHGARNHFSSWLKARTEFSLAHELRPRQAAEFGSAEGLRSFLIRSLRAYREKRIRGIITDFSKETFNPKSSLARIGGGSLGGKARGLGFINSLITRYNVRNHFEGIEIMVPSAVVIGTDIFDRFMEGNRLVNFALSCDDDEEVTRRFLAASEFSKEVTLRLSEFLDLVHEPLAVRSSSLLEDSQYQPFAGVYHTYMIPNNHPNPRVRLQELLDSVKRVYASTFFKRAKDYIRATEYRLEEEKMAVVIQRVVGSSYDCRYYPDFAGVAKSYNFYPVAPQKSTDGIAMVALGLGKMVVDGGNAVRFCPKYPRHLPQFFSAQETVQNAQQSFFALNQCSGLPDASRRAEDVLVQKFDLSEAEKDGTLNYTASTYSAENDAVYDGIARDGQRIVTLAPLLKYGVFPLPQILELVLDIGSWGMGGPVEIEFAVNMNVGWEESKEFGLLQMRPMVLGSETEALDVDFKDDDLIVESTQVLGNGRIQEVFDVIVVDPDQFDRVFSRDVAQEVAQINAKLVREKRPYVLIGMGRWGSLDPWLGIPVTWDQIAGAAAIVEAGFKDISVVPSQGSHFFQNITSFRVGYFTISDWGEQGFIDWKWLRSQKAVEEKRFTRHLRFESPILARINGHKNKGVIIKPTGMVSAETLQKTAQ